jgi:hypothetical protein
VQLLLLGVLWQGIEETVPLDIVSCINGPVVTVIGDYDGSVNSDLTNVSNIT